MAHPIVETKWTLEKIRTFLNNMDSELDEAEYQLSKSEEVIESAEKWEGTKAEIKPLVEKAIRTLEDAGYTSADKSIMDTLKLLSTVVKELEK